MNIRIRVSTGLCSIIMRFTNNSREKITFFLKEKRENYLLRLVTRDVSIRWRLDSMYEIYYNIATCDRNIFFIYRTLSVSFILELNYKWNIRIKKLKNRFIDSARTKCKFKILNRQNVFHKFWKFHFLPLKTRLTIDTIFTGFLLRFLYHARSVSQPRRYRLIILDRRRYVWIDELRNSWI